MAMSLRCLGLGVFGWRCVEAEAGGGNVEGVCVGEGASAAWFTKIKKDPGFGLLSLSWTQRYIYYLKRN